MRALLKNTTLRTAVALLVAIFCICLLSACGGSSGSAQSLIDDTFAGHTQIESGVVNLSFALGASGQSSSTKPLTVSLSGPFQGNGNGKLPRFALRLQLSAAGHGLGAGATSTGSALFVELAGTWFSTPSSTYKSLEQGYAQATKKASTAKASSFSSLGIEPGRWLSNPVKAGTATVGGVSTVHLTAGIDVPAFLADVTRLSQSSSALGLGSVPGASSASGALSPTVITELAKSIKSAHVDIYTGEGDHMLRRLEVSANVTPTPQTQSLLDGLTSAQLKVRLEFSDLNQPQTISAPSNPQPPSQLLPAVQQLVGLLEGSTGSSSSGGALEPLSQG